MQTTAKRMAAVRTSAARTGETGTLITLETPVRREKSSFDFHFMISKKSFEVHLNAVDEEFSHLNFNWQRERR